jgi:DMSO/TMAO reductase YedYZ molybdopterin-dependent catalytic subunit
MSFVRRWARVVGSGLLAGLVAALFMTVAMALLRLILGIPLPSEMGGDRFLPYLGVFSFLSLLGRFGGTTGSKMLALLATFEGQVIVGCLIGLLYAVIVERGRDPERPPRRFDISRRGGLFVVVAAGLIWLVSLGLFSGLGWPWSVLGANNLGVPPGWGSVVTALGLLVSYAGYGLVLVLTYGFITGRAGRRRLTTADDEAGEPESMGRPVGRRAFLAGAAGVILALSSDWLTRRLIQNSTLSYDGTSYLGTNLQPITPNDQFYIVTKNIIDPDPVKAPWRLQMTGQVDQPRTYSFDDLAALPSVEQEMTLRCISTGVDGGLMSNAVWTGVPLPRLLEDAGPKSDVVQVRIRGVDGYTHLASFDKAMEETTLVAYQMNGEPLPQRHGYPARVLVPGYYGEASVKWVTRVELFNTDDVEAYYEKQGWEPTNVHTISRIDQPQDGQSLSLSQTIPSIKGVAFSGDRGISKVEVSTDGGDSWQEANIDYKGTKLTWAFWSYDWQPDASGEYQLMARATDGNGDLQTSEKRRGAPSGSSGYPMVTAQVEA